MFNKVWHMTTKLVSKTIMYKLTNSRNSEFWWIHEIDVKKKKTKPLLNSGQVQV